MFNCAKAIKASPVFILALLLLGALFLPKLAAAAQPLEEGAPKEAKSALYQSLYFQGESGDKLKIVYAKTKAPAAKKINASAPKKSPTGGGIGKPGTILSKTKVVGGKRVCKTNNDHPHKSKNGNKKGHIDGECCLDPDETPNANCYYPQAKYQKMIQKYLKSQK